MRRRGAVTIALLLVVVGIALLSVGAPTALTLFAALVLGIFWKRATGIAASLGMVSGLGVTLYYMIMNQPWLRGVFNITSPVDLWFGILPISAGVFGVPLGFAVIVIVSLITPAPSAKIRELVEHVRYPSLRGDINTQGT